ncbi:MAG: FKBP-type peptidyl-prolyl cis-trans isomerase [Flavisolibacter sp.]
MKILKSLAGILCVILLLASCNSIDFKKSRGGVPYKIFSSKTGEKIAMGNIVKYMLTMKVNDSVIRTSYGNYPEYEQISAPGNSYEDPHMELISKAKEGDSIYYVQSMDTFIAKNPVILQQTPFKRGDKLSTTIKIVKVFRNSSDAQSDAMKERTDYMGRMQKQSQEQLVKDDKAIQDYLTANHIQAQKSEKGTYVQIITPGEGPKATEGKSLMIRYKGTNFAGETFDSNQEPNAPLLPLQPGQGGSIPGFEDGVKDLTKGTKAKIYIPSSLAYGPQGRMPKIKPNENLIFDIEIVDIKDAPKQGSQIMPRVDSVRKHK